MKVKIRSEFGATFLEYVVVAAILGMVIYSAATQLSPKSSDFYSDIGTGLGLVYPSAFWSS
ncbi:MAG: hypothetical protein SGJ02_07925 [bacterium]|nr:hypothetical protein [bacterium]